MVVEYKDPIVQEQRRYSELQQLSEGSIKLLSHNMKVWEEYDRDMGEEMYVY